MTMRLLASTLLVLLAAIYLHPEGVQADSTKDDVSNEVTGLITSVVGGISEAAVAALSYPNTIRMPVPVAAAVGAGNETATNIIGRDGQCMDVERNRYIDGDLIVLWACGNAQRNQLWTFESDGTIRSNGKCLTANGSTPGNYIMIFDCDTAVPEATKWILSNIGTIMNPISGLVISAENSAQGTVLTLAKDNNSSRQAWTARNYTEPTINYISGFRNMCLQANVAKNWVWLECCVLDTEPRQHWALYGDRTIRLFNDRTLCVTSNGHANKARIGVDTCRGLDDQRWFFKADGSILNPISQYVMDVKAGDVSLQQIILFANGGSAGANEQWLVHGLRTMLLSAAYVS